MRETRSPTYGNCDEAFLLIALRLSVFRLCILCLFLHVQMPLEPGCFGICNACWFRALQKVLGFLQLCNNLLIILCQLSAQTLLFSPCSLVKIRFDRINSYAKTGEVNIRVRWRDFWSQHRAALLSCQYLKYPQHFSDTSQKYIYRNIQARFAPDVFSVQGLVTNGL